MHEIKIWTFSLKYFLEYNTLNYNDFGFTTFFFFFNTGLQLSTLHGLHLGFGFDPWFSLPCTIFEKVDLGFGFGPWFALNHRLFPF